MTFYVPQTLAADFDDFLNTDVPNQVKDFEVYHDWYTPEDVYTIRAEIYPDSTKSRYENMDNALNMRASLTSGLLKGDIIKDTTNNMLWLVDWETIPETNNIPTRIMRCNAYIAFYRNVEDMVDDDGYLVHEKGTKLIAYKIPVNMYRYDGRPDSGSHEWTPGIMYNGLYVVSVQCNEITSNIKVGDHYDYAGEGYTIVDIDRTGLSMNGKTGAFQMTAKKTAGEQ